MLNLQKRISGVDEERAYIGTRVTIRDKLLAQGSSYLLNVLLNAERLIVENKLKMQSDM